MDPPKREQDQSTRQGYSDLEHAEAYDAPQVVDEFHLRAPIQRNASTDSPQLHTPEQHKPEYGYYAGRYDARPYYENEKP